MFADRREAARAIKALGARPASLIDSWRWWCGAEACNTSIGFVAKARG